MDTSSLTSKTDKVYFLPFIRNSGILISELPESLVALSAAVVFSAATFLELCLDVGEKPVLPIPVLDETGLFAGSETDFPSSLSPVAITVTVT